MALSDNIDAYYNFDETSGTNVNDEVGSNDGTHSAGVTVNQTGKIDKCILLAGESAPPVLDIPSDGYSTNWSFSLWIKKASGGDGASKRILEGEGGSNPVFTFESTGATELTIYGGGGATQWDTGWVPTDGTWYHVVYVMDTAGTDTQYLYINGSESATQNNTRTHTGNNWIVGNNSSGTRTFSGNIDELGFWDRALTAAEASSLYNSGSGLAYPYSTNITLTPATLTLSTTQKEPIIKVLVSPLIINAGVGLLTPNIDTSELPSHIVVGTGGIGTRFINTEWPVVEGLIAGTTKQKGRIMNLVPTMSNVTQDDSVGIDN